MTSTTVTSRIWLSDGTTYTWPEQQAGVKVNLGVCFSGGGTRALAAAMGQLRGLIDIGLLDSVDYISCISGGSWAATPFAYYRAGASSDAAFLGPIVEPADITLAGLDQTLAALGETATVDFGDVLVQLYEAGVSHDELWESTVGQVFLQPFGLYDPTAPAYFSLDDATVATIQQNNLSLASATFFTVRKPDGYSMPYLLINATVDGPKAHAPYSPESLVMVTFSPLGCGVPFQQTIGYFIKGTTATKLRLDALVGGGMIEPFAWGSEAPAAPPANGLVSVVPRATPFTLANASGTSSAAYAATLEHIKNLEGIDPDEQYWPPVPAGSTQPAAQQFLFGDGGNLENYGIIPLLVRGVKNIVVFINTETKLSTTYDSTSAPTSADIDMSLAALFGFPTNWAPQTPGTPDNQVFPQSDWQTLVSSMQALKNGGQAIVQSSSHQLQRNDWWGLAGGSTVNVLWVYLDTVKDWQGAIKSDEVRIELDLGNHGIGSFPHFPNYRTIDENLPVWSLVKLTRSQVNLLSDLTCWVVRNSAAAFKALT